MKLKLKNYFQIGIGVGLLIALIGGVVWVQGGYSLPEISPKRSIVEQAEDDSNMDEIPMDSSESQKEILNKDTMAAPEKKIEAVDLIKASEFFAQALRQLTSCLSVNTGNPADRVEPNFENILSIVKEDLGDPILRSEDWVVWNLRISGGEERRIRVESNYSDNTQPSRHLLYFKLDAAGNPTLMPLPPDATKDPSEAFIASLQKDGEVYEEKKGERAYFEAGQELVVIQKNGSIDDFEFANGVKTFRCEGILTSSPKCKCN
ncbi:MAG: hypothetical protein IPM97_09540 [Bdellovibrionaceae bacterium]|nr:hypothetical protein [Pseudobdellovibrionaceae bacterium]